jgi:hypothetical protein
MCSSTFTVISFPSAAYVEWAIVRENGPQQTDVSSGCLQRDDSRRGSARASEA